MRRASILLVAALMLAACAQDERADAPQMPERSPGKTIVFRPNAVSSVVALHLDQGSYRNYADVSEVGGPSDIGGDLRPCGEGISKCVEFSGLYIMVPPSNGDGWFFWGLRLPSCCGLIGSPKSRCRGVPVWRGELFIQIQSAMRR